MFLRRVQDGWGDFLGDRIREAGRGLSLELRYPLGRSLSLLMTGEVITYSSNMQYEVYYPYNYTVSKYLLGFSWEN